MSAIVEIRGRTHAFYWPWHDIKEALMKDPTFKIEALVIHCVPANYRRGTVATYFCGREQGREHVTWDYPYWFANPLGKDEQHRCKECWESPEMQLWLLKAVKL